MMLDEKDEELLNEYLEGKYMEMIFGCVEDSAYANLIPMAEIGFSVAINFCWGFSIEKYWKKKPDD